MATNKPNAPRVPLQTTLDPALWRLVKVQAATEGIPANQILERALRRELEIAKKSPEQREVA